MASSGLPTFPLLDGVNFESASGTSPLLTRFRPRLRMRKARPVATASSPLRFQVPGQAIGDTSTSTALPPMHADGVDTPIGSSHVRASNASHLPPFPILSSRAPSVRAGGQGTVPILRLQPRLSVSQARSPRGVDSVNVMGYLMHDAAPRING